MLHGLVTETDLPAIEESFPGIWGFYLELREKPTTFLELAWRYSACRGRRAGEAAEAMAPQGASPATLR